tara:strand:+ start:1422 stop:1586 length:165 start_codon:yes stop_codon:yes gene_type:complete
MKLDENTSEYKDEPIYKMGMLQVLRQLGNITFCGEEITRDILIEFNRKMMDEIK